MTRVLLVRHGATGWNESGRLQGWADTGLTARGRADAARVADRLVGAHDVDRIVSSPLRRATETAEVLVGRTEAGSVETHPGWRERSFGSCEGMRAEAAFERYPALHPKSSAFSPDASLDGESARAVVTRVSDVWRSLCGRADGDETVAVVTHESPLRIVVGLVGAEGPFEALRTRSFTPGTVLAVDGRAAGAGEWSVVTRG